MARRMYPIRAARAGGKFGAGLSLMVGLFALRQSTSPSYKYLPAMTLAAAKRSLNQRIKAALAVERKAAAERVAAEKRGRAAQKKVQIWLPAADVHALKTRALDEDTTIQALVGAAVRALLHE